MRIREIVLLVAALAMPGAAFAAGKSDARTGKKIYQAHCAMCHGPDGQGNGALGKMMKVTIPPLSSKEVQALTDTQMRATIEKGKGKMAPVKGVSSAQIDDAIAFVRALGRK